MDPKDPLRTSKGGEPKAENRGRTGDENQGRRTKGREPREENRGRLTGYKATRCRRRSPSQDVSVVIPAQSLGRSLPASLGTSTFQLSAIPAVPPHRPGASSTCCRGQPLQLSLHI
ncbi:hypothetical protein SKAU_G00305320 [Synaphobranchus kaupii]|uniref:Uncharacterized protein n=1 Tax=Synaphobranchus kaupii TaxID=118154 RepID=A0A9Q1EQN2_SYNKA|nr:hypothetical protein SKAU_G00305320 [Synaphobranchus kaupii]